MRFGVAIVLVLIVFFTHCSKTTIEPVAGNATIAVLAGNNQRDTVGRVLKQEVHLQVNTTNYAVTKTKIRIVQPGCGYTTEGLYQPGADGLLRYSWKLNSTIGEQKLRIYVLDSLNQVMDSALANATGLFFDNVWLPADCLPQNASGDAIASLPDNRIVAALGQLYFSANNGMNWGLVPTFPAGARATKVSVSNNRVLVGGANEIYYSPDNMATWQRVSGTLNLGGFPPLAVTRSGKFLVSTVNGVMLSVDEGKTWANISTQANAPGYSSFYHSFCESANGVLYALNDRNELWSSVDGGAKWQQSLSDVISIFSDDNGDMYAGQVNMFLGDKVCCKKNGSATWLVVASIPGGLNRQTGITQISKVNNRFYCITNNDLVRTTDFSSFTIIYPYSVTAYCITGLNGGIVSRSTPFSSEILYNIHP